MRAFMLFFLAIAAGCSDPEPIPNTPDMITSAEGYDKGCAADADCILVFTGNVCGCDCTQEAINASESARYAAAEAEKRQACTEVLSCQPCPDTQQAICTQATCAAVTK